MTPGDSFEPPPSAQPPSAQPPLDDADDQPPDAGPSTAATAPLLAPEHVTLKYSLLGPSLTKAGQDSVDQSKVSEIIYNASKGSKFFNREEERDKTLTVKIDRILKKKRELEVLNLSRDLRKSDYMIAALEHTRDLTQHIVHLDCDAFYAAVEQLERPELKDLPFAVGGGVLTTCNYVARKYGCRSGMAGFVAKKLCPELVFIKPNFEKYVAKASEVRQVIAEYDPRFESASIDEAYLNITEYCRENDMTPEDAVEQMRRQVHQKTDITVSAGIAANAKLAKICSNMNKPNGQYLLPSDRIAIMDFMRDLPCRKVNGIGRVLERQLAALDIHTCGDIYYQRQYLTHLFGEKANEFLLECLLGIGRTNVQPAEEYERKSVGTESTFHDISGPQELRDKLCSTAEELEKDLRKAQCKGRTLVLKVKLHTFEVLTRQTVLPKAIHLAPELYNYALPILAKLEQENPGMKIRLMGLRCTHLVSTRKPDTLAFFGLKPKSGNTSEPGKVLRNTANEEEEEEDDDDDDDDDDDGWQKWPEEGMDDHEIPPDVQNRPCLDEIAKMLTRIANDGPTDATGQGDSPQRRHGKEIMPNPTPKKKKAPCPPQEEWWQCPICSRPQTADERQFNDHIDTCLSRQAIKDTLQKDAVQVQSVDSGATPEPKVTQAMPAKKKRGRPPATIQSNDPKQKKLCFG